MHYEQTLGSLLETVIKEDGSDIHLSPGRRPTIRVAGFLVPLLQQPILTLEDMQGFMHMLLTKANRDLFIAEQEIDFSYAYGEEARFRGNGFFHQGMIGFALRLIPRKIRTLEELRLPQSIELFAQKQQGFFLVVGPVGHGKTTTLAAMVDLINKNRAEHIITIEDPIEYIFEQQKSMIDQREVRIDTKDFHEALHSAFRQDVDVIMVGEMRGIETIATAVTAAETGHLVLSTLHTNNAAQTIDRIIDSFPPGQQDQIRIQLAGSLVGIFSQRLIPRISGGLVPAYELLVNTTAIANIIREGRTHEISSVVETGSEHGMVSMDRSLVELVRAGEITIENAYLHSYSPQALEKML